MKKQKRPTLTLIGASGVLAGAALIGGCDKDTSVRVERAGYASQADCERDWSRVDDCSFIIDGAQAASGAGSSNSTGGVHGGAGGGHWYGPYYTQSGKVYHANGQETNESVRTTNSSSISESTTSESALSGHDSEAISRGGFGESAHAGGGGDGGHGG